MTHWVKICGLSDEAGVAAAVDAGADAIGFVFAPSPREVTPARAAALAERVRGAVTIVAVMRHPAPAFAAEVQRVLRPDYLQTDAADFDNIELGDAVSPLPVYRDDGALPAALPEQLLYEGALSGSGTTADWEAAKRCATGTRLILAGGLAPGNVAAAIAAVRPWGVDVSSGVEIAPGVKDPARIRAFIAAARQHDNDRRRHR